MRAAVTIGENSRMTIATDAGYRGRGLPVSRPGTIRDWTIPAAAMARTIPHAISSRKAVEKRHQRSR